MTWFRHHYRCERCNNEWYGEDDAIRHDDCAVCHRSCDPLDSEVLVDDGEDGLIP